MQETPFFFQMYDNSMKYMILIFISVFLFADLTFGEKVLVYDEERGIVFIDKNNKSNVKKKTKKSNIKNIRPQPTILKKTVKPKHPDDIHINRKKDPPELYFESGQKYYKNKDFDNALKNFKFAAGRQVKPKYLLWIGKVYRQTNKKTQMLSIFKRILDDYPDSDVADDALFEIAFYYQVNNNYENATKLYGKLAEQYPFGLSFSNGEEFLEASRTQQRAMRGEIASALKYLGINGETLPETYSNFQKQHKLKITGTGTFQTISLIKKLYKNQVLLNEKKEESNKRIQDSIKWLYLLGFVIFIGFITVLSAQFKLKQNRNQLVLMKEMLSDLK